jgi:4-amino-4-deoxy-L-arabinose transferase-like glycosyltransferase
MDDSTPNPSSPSSGRDSRPFAAVFFLVLAVGAYFRLARLGVPALRADTITFWNICNSGLSAREIFRDWISLGHTGHFPFANSFIRGFLDFFGLPLTHFTLRLPSALWGTATIPAVYGLARCFTGRPVALLAAALLALSPYHIQISQEAYFYPPMVLGACLLMWGVALAVQSLGGKSLGWNFVALTGAGTFLVTYSIPAGWQLFLLCLLVLVGTGVTEYVRLKKVDRKLLIGLGVGALVILPFFFAPWGFSQFSGHFGATKELGVKTQAYVGGSPWTLVMDFVLRYGWGTTPVRSLFSWLVVVLVLLGFAREVRRRPSLALLVYFVVGTGLVFLAARRAGGMLYEVRYTIAALPAWLVLVAVGLQGIRNLLPARTGPWAAAAVTALALGLWVRPAYLATCLTGKPTPYKEIQSWVNKNLPSGTPVLVDRWFEPWNELRVYDSTNVTYTFTIPNEPLDMFQKYNWRGTAEAFLEQNPDAAYLEIAKSYWDVPSVGRWQWPRDFFANHHVFSNSAGVVLRHMGMAARPDFYSNDTNRTVVEVFYNTTDDLVSKARRNGRAVFSVFGDGWTLAKLWPGVQDFRSWRVMSPAAALRVFNVTERQQDVYVMMRAAGGGTDKRITVEGGPSHVFTNGVVDTWAFGPVPLAPGESRLVFRDEDPVDSSGRLFVENVLLSTNAPGLKGDAVADAAP